VKGRHYVAFHCALSFRPLSLQRRSTYFPQYPVLKRLQSASFFYKQ
jgi:hypothetical protein